MFALICVIGLELPDTSPMPPSPPAKTMRVSTTHDFGPRHTAVVVFGPYIDGAFGADYLVVYNPYRFYCAKHRFARASFIDGVWVIDRIYADGVSYYCEEEVFSGEALPPVALRKSCY